MGKKDWNAGLCPVVQTVPHTGIWYAAVKHLCSNNLSKV